MIQRVQPHEVQRELANHGSRVRVVQESDVIPGGGKERLDPDYLHFDGEYGPRQYSNDGTFSHPIKWQGMTPTIKEVVMHQTAKRNRGRKEQFEYFAKQHNEKVEDLKLQAALKDVDAEMQKDSQAQYTSVLDSLQKSAKVSELSLEQALGLQDLLIEGFSNPGLRRKLSVLKAEHGEGSTRFNNERHNLVGEVYTKVLPMFGFEHTYQGVYDVRQAFASAEWREDATVKKNQAHIWDLLYGAGEEFVEEEEEAKEEEDEADGPYRYRAAEERCAKEQAKPQPTWKGVSYEQLQEHHLTMAPGILYGLEFPFTAEGLEEMGPVWLTKAFQAAETIPADARVTKITSVKTLVKGGAGSKFMFTVEYDKHYPDLHTRLFAKIPFPYEGKTRSDRMAMSVNQQGQELQEINAYRLLESRFPFRIPRYYFGDISNLSTNFILITECVPYGEKDGPRQLEPSYHKFKDWELMGPPEEYYYLLVRIGTNLAGAYKNGDLGPKQLLDQVFGNAAARPIEHWGMGPKSSGVKDAEFKMKISMGADFVSEVGKELFPGRMRTKVAMDTYIRVLSKVNSYSAEARWWCNRNQDYVAWTHINLNVDNVFFWRNKQKQLDAGVLDWGGVTCNSIGFQLWWWLYSCEFEFLDAHLDGLINCIVDTYKTACGLQLSAEELKLQFTLSAILQGIGVLGAVPMIYRMCPKKEWKTIKDKRDERICADVDGTGNLRIYVGTFINIVRMIHSWNLEKVVDDWINEFTEVSKIPKKEYYKP